MTEMVLVDGNDNITGHKEKLATHQMPVPLHRAISVVIFNKDESLILITKRSYLKPTWPGYWTNTVCSHPFPKEEYKKAAQRRLKEEMGINTPLKEVFNFIYKARYDKNWGECELDHVFTGKYEGKITPDYKEISGYQWIEIKELKKDMKKNPKIYTPWFKIIVGKLV